MKTPSELPDKVTFLCSIPYPGISKKRIYAKKTFERGNFYICLYLIGPFSMATKPVNMATKPIGITTACVLYFLKNLQKSFLFQLKSSFCSPIIQFLVFFCFSTVSTFKGSDGT